MNGTKLLADTNVVINHLAGYKQAEAVLEGNIIYISSLSFAELLSSSLLSMEEEQLLRAYLSSVHIVHTNDFNCETAAQIRRKIKITLPDALIAATCLFLGIPLVTFDKDFERINDITIIKLSY